MTAVDRGSPTEGSWAQRYRRRRTWGSAIYGSHPVDCYPGDCAWHVFVKDGRIVREEQVPEYVLELLTSDVGAMPVRYFSTILGTPTPLGERLPSSGGRHRRRAAAVLSRT
jgi:hypothetical protein